MEEILVDVIKTILSLLVTERLYQETLVASDK